MPLNKFSGGQDKKEQPKEKRIEGMIATPPMQMGTNEINQQMDRFGIGMIYPPNGAVQNKQINQCKRQHILV